MKIIVYHSLYGFETNCRGHYVQLLENMKEFSETMKEFAQDVIKQEYGKEHVKDLDWENCQIKDDHE